jgi:ferredoxin
MVVAEIKPFNEIKDMVRGYKRLMVLGCGACVSVCFTGGKKQVELLASSLRISNKKDGVDVEIGEGMLARQCDPRFVEQIKDSVDKYDAILSMGCGAGVQEISEILNIPVLPAMNTVFIGAAGNDGNFVEMCRACGDCLLSLTAGICPLTKCPKGLLNGPCGGNKDGMCEVSTDLPCAWVRIYERLKAMGKLDQLKIIFDPKDWSKTQRPGKFCNKEK